MKVNVAKEIDTDEEFKRILLEVEELCNCIHGDKETKERAIKVIVSRMIEMVALSSYDDGIYEKLKYLYERL